MAEQFGEALRGPEFLNVQTLFGYAVDRVRDESTDLRIRQEPPISPPRQAQPFGFGRLTPEDRREIPLPPRRPGWRGRGCETRPSGARSTPSSWSPRFKAALLDATGPGRRGEVPPAVAVDADETDLPDAILPAGSYRIALHGAVSSCWRGDVPLGPPLLVTGTRTNLETLARDCARAVLAALAKRADG